MDDDDDILLPPTSEYGSMVESGIPLPMSHVLGLSFNPLEDEAVEPDVIVPGA